MSKIKDEARKRGLDPNEFSSAAIRRCLQSRHNGCSK